MPDYRPFVTISCQAYGIPHPEPEFRFHATRRWKLDFAWVPQKVALEIQGGIFTQGRHTRGASLLKEYEKLNTAAAMGWRFLFSTPGQLRDGSIFPIICQALGLN